MQSYATASQGPQGFQGFQGPAGPTGLGPAILVRDVFNNIVQVNQGIQGFQGNQGAQGPQGAGYYTAVAAKYTSSSAQSMSLTPVALGYATQVFDTHNAGSGTGSTWKWTVPLTGKYFFTAAWDISTSGTGSQYGQIYIAVNGTDVVAATTRSFTSGQTAPSVNTAVVADVAAGDEITVKGVANFNASRTTSGNPLWDVFTAHRIA